MCKAKNASHIRTASTAAAECPNAKTTNQRLHKIFDTTGSIAPFSVFDLILFSIDRLTDNVFSQSSSYGTLPRMFRYPSIFDSALDIL
jgi:hypothetical protein